MASKIYMQGGNKGLTVKLNLWPTDSQPDALHARRFIAGQVTHADTGEEKLFKDAGELLSILGKWNVQKFKELSATKKTTAKTV